MTQSEIVVSLKWSEFLPAFSLFIHITFNPKLKIYKGSSKAVFKVWKEMRMTLKREEDHKNVNPKRNNEAEKVSPLCPTSGLCFYKPNALKLLRIPGSTGLGWTWGIENIQEKQDWGSAEGGEGQLAFSQGQVAMVSAHCLWERQPSTCLRKASSDSVLVSVEQPTLRETVPWFTASAGFPAGIILTRAGFKLPTWHHCTQAWEEL